MEINDLVINRKLKMKIPENREAYMLQDIKLERRENGKLLKGLKKSEIKIVGKPVSHRESFLATGQHLQYETSSSFMTKQPNGEIDQSPFGQIRRRLECLDTPDNIPCSPPKFETVLRKYKTRESEKVSHKLNSADVSRFASTIDDLSRSLLKSSETSPSPPIDQEFIPPSVVTVPEGYGCKCPKTVRRLFKIIRIIVLLLYISGMPLLIYHLHSKIQNTKRRIRIFEKKLIYDIKYNPRVMTRDSMASAPYDDIDMAPNRFATVGNFRKEYDRSMLIKKSIAKALKNVKEKMKNNDERFTVLAKVQQVLKSNPENLPPLPSFQQGECECIEEDDDTESTTNPSKVSSPSMKGNIIPTSTYIRWGKESCPKKENTATLYSGFISGTSNIRGSTGSKYLCMPKISTNYKPPKTFNTSGVTKTSTNSIHAAFLDASRPEDSKLFGNAISGLQYALCSLCEVTNRNNVLMIPARNECPDETWTKEYDGYLMAQKEGKKKTEFVCVDKSPDKLVNSVEKTRTSFRTLTLLNFVETKCHALPCRGSGYEEQKEMTCVVCTK